jgi:hypothetical protein
MYHYNDSQIEAELSGVLEGKKEGDEPVIIGFFGDRLAYTAADSAGTARMHYSPEIRIIRVPLKMVQMEFCFLMRRAESFPN